MSGYKKHIALVLVLIACILILSSCDKVPAGHRGVIVNLYGSDKGIQEESVGVGRYYVGWNRELYIFPTFLQNHSWDHTHTITMQTSEGLSIKTDAGITYSIKPENVVKVFQKYRLGIEEITDTFLHNMVRDAMNAVSSTMNVEQIYGGQKERFIHRVTELVQKEAAENGIDVAKIYLIGSIQLPESVINSINLKIEASQNALRVENEVAATKAEAQKTIVEAQAKSQQILINAESQAKANRILASSITPEFIQYQTILKWNGILPTTTSSGVIPFLNIDGK